MHYQNLGYPCNKLDRRSTARKDVNHQEHDWAKEAGYVDWAHDEIHADAVSEQFAKLQRQKARRTSRWVMED